MNFSFLKQSTAQRRDLILTAPIPATLAVLSVPTILFAAVQALMPVVDGIFINNTSGILVASSVTFSGPILSMMLALSQGASVAATALIGQLNGKGDFQKSKDMAVQLVVAGSLAGIGAAPILAMLAKIATLNINVQIQANVFLYLSLNAFILPFYFLESIYNGIKNANGQPEAPFIRMIILLLAKIVFNAVFLSWLNLGILGCVAASFFANFAVTLWMFYELFANRTEDRLSLKNFRFNIQQIRQIIMVGSPAAINSFLLSLGFYLIGIEVEKFGPVMLNAQGIAGSISQICFTIPGSFASGVTTMVSMFIGNNNGESAKKSCIYGSVLSALTAVVLIAIVVPLSPFLTVLFTRQQQVLEVANSALHIYTYSVVGFGICMTIQGAFIGLGKTKVPLVLGFLRIWLLRYLFILVTEKFLGVYSVFWGNLFSNYAAMLIAIILIYRTKWKSAL